MHNRTLFDDRRTAFFGITTDPQDVAQRRVTQELPGIRWFFDEHRSVSRAYGAVAERESFEEYHPHWVLLDPTMRVHAVADLQDAQDIIGLMRTAAEAGSIPSPQAPVLIVPNILPPEMCRQLIATFETRGGRKSGFMRQIGDRTHLVVDSRAKRRSDYNIEEPQLRAALKSRISLALLPMIYRAFQFKVTRIERYTVAKYDGIEKGFFTAHRDNTTAGTAHRKFACTINLNSDDYEGGDLCFPEFGPKRFRAPTGGAVVFSCSLLHEAQAVTRGSRYAFLPFFYDEAGAELRKKNAGSISLEVPS
jgi:predicted 2-oxoglutarate/Fe(II)-dependent dioxygenase YbiX